MRHNAVFFVAYFFTILACSDADVSSERKQNKDSADSHEDINAEPAELCTPLDSPSYETVMTYAAYSSLDRVFPGQQVLYENGYEFFIIDSHCHVLFFSGLNDNRGWAPIYKSKINPADLKFIRQDIEIINWTDKIQTGPEISSHPSHIIINLEKKSYQAICSNCDVLSPIKISRGILAKMFMGRKEEVKEKIRYLAHEIEPELLPSLEDREAVKLKLNSDIDSYSYGELSMLGRGASQSISDGEDIAVLFELRNNYLQLGIDRWWYEYIPLEVKEKRYHIYFRSSLPEIENENGLIEELKIP